MDPDKFRLIKTLFGAMDDLCQQRRRTYTAWVGNQMSPEDFAAAMRDNLARTKETMVSLEAELFGA